VSITTSGYRRSKLPNSERRRVRWSPGFKGGEGGDWSAGWVVQVWGQIRVGGQIISGWTETMRFSDWVDAMRWALGQENYHPYPLVRVQHRSAWGLYGERYRCTLVWPDGVHCDTTAVRPWLANWCARHVPAHLVGEP
jgi:hypothetical protein